MIIIKTARHTNINKHRALPHLFQYNLEVITKNIPKITKIQNGHTYQAKFKDVGTILE